MKERMKNTCTPCEKDFEHKVNELVKEGKAPTAKEREKRGTEVKAAYAGHPHDEKKK